MTLDELKALWEKATKDLEAKPDDAELKTKVDEALAAYEAKKLEVESDPEHVDETKLDDKTKAYLAKLRKENANHRTKNKELTSKFSASEEQKKAILKAAGLLEEEKPEDKLKLLTAESQDKDFQLAVLQSAVENGVPKDQLEFYEFMIRKATSSLQDGEELSEEALTKILTQVKKNGSKGSANTSVNGEGKGKEDPAPGSGGDITLAKFIKMGILEKSKLFEEKPAVYNALMQEARAAKKLV